MYLPWIIPFYVTPQNNWAVQNANVVSVKVGDIRIVSSHLHPFSDVYPERAAEFSAISLQVPELPTAEMVYSTEGMIFSQKSTWHMQGTTCASAVLVFF